MAAETRKSRKSNFSQEEVDVLVTTVMQNHDILYKETSKSFFHKEIRNQVWNIILEEVNKVAMERRTLNEIKNKWKKCQYSVNKTNEKNLDNNSDGSFIEDLVPKIFLKNTHKMKSKKRGRKILTNPASKQGHVSCYEPTFKRSVILFAEQKGDRDASKRFNVPEITIKRWRFLKADIMEKAQQNVRRSQRHSIVQGSFSTETSPKKGNSSEELIVDLSSELDSMPLEKRLSQNHDEVPVQETVLQSQPISPTKLKVTRQGKPHVLPPTQTASPPPALPPEICLKWNSQHMNMQSVFTNLLLREQYVDATLVSEGKTLKCHRIVLSMCSPYFEEVLNGIGPFQHPVLFMKDVPFWTLKALCDFMYAGEIRILQDKLDDLLNVANILKIKGLAGIPESAEQVKPSLPKIKQEKESFSTLLDKPLKQEQEEEPPPSTPPRTPTPKLVGRPSRHESLRSLKHKVVESLKDETIKAQETLKPSKQELLRLSRKREEKKSKHVTNLKEKEKVTKEILSQNQSSIKVPSASKRVIRRNETLRKLEKNKIEIAVAAKTEQEKDKLPLKKDNINDPLDLLQPVYEEIAKDECPVIVKNISIGRLKERSNVPVKRGVGRKVRKRRYAEYKEDIADISQMSSLHKSNGLRNHESVRHAVRAADNSMTGGSENNSAVTSANLKLKMPCGHCKKSVLFYAKCIKCKGFFHPSCLRQAARQKNTICVHLEEDNVDESPPPPPLFQSRKGTRSRPNVKIPKFFHTHYEDSPKDSTDATIVREPHTDHNDPLIGEVDEIKTEPLDVEENTLGWLSQDTEEEEIMGNYDSPLVNIAKRSRTNIFNKVLEAQQVIMDLHSAPETGIVNIKQENLQLVDINQFSKEIDESLVNFDSMESPRENKSGIIITDIQSMADISEESRLSNKGQEEPTEELEKTQENLLMCENIKDVSRSIEVRPLELLTVDSREFGTSSTTTYSSAEAIPQLEADPLAEISGLESGTLEINDESQNKNEGATRENSKMLFEDKIQHQIEATEEKNVSTEIEKNSVKNPKVLINEAVVERSEPNKEKLQNIFKDIQKSDEIIKEVPSFLEEKAKVFTDSTMVSEIIESLEIENDILCNEAKYLAEKLDKTSNELTNPTLTCPLEECLETENTDNSKLLPSQNEKKVTLHEGILNLVPDCLEPQAIELPLDTVYNEDLSEPVIKNRLVTHQTDIEEPKIDKKLTDVLVSNILEPITKNQQENIKVMTADIEEPKRNDTDKLIPEPSKHIVENIEPDLQTLDGEQKIGNIENTTVLSKQETESNKNIETELQQCLASTSNFTPLKSSGKRLSFNVPPLPLENRADFTKDIEFENLIPCNRSTNYLGDCGANFDMKEAAFEESNKPTNDAGNYQPTKNDEENIETRGHQKTNFVEPLQDNVAINIRNNLETDSSLVQEPHPEESLALNSNSGFLTSLESLEEEQKIEESLLADLDEDIEMKEASQIENDGTEKTLEMIVNDLNESLGEMKQ